MRAISVSIWPRNRSASPGLRGALHDAREQRFGIRRTQVRGARGRMAVIGGGGAHDGEERAALAMRGDVAAPGQRVFTGDRAESLEVVEEAEGVRIDHGIGAVRGDHAPVPAALADGDVMQQVVERRLGGRERLDVEALEQRARPELGLLQPLGDAVVGRCRRFPASAECGASNTLDSTQSNHMRVGVPRNR